MENYAVLKEDEGVRVVRTGNRVVKTVRGLNKSGLFGIRYGPKTMIDREVKALELLRDVKGIQRLVERLKENTIVTEYIEGKSLKTVEKGELKREYFRDLKEVVKECNARGVYRIGQGRLDFLVTPEGNPAIIDFGHVFFRNDSSARIPGAKKLAEKYTLWRIDYLERQLC